MTAPWMPPLPEPMAWSEGSSIRITNYTADQMRQAQADAARAALEQAAAAMRNELVSATTDQTIRDSARWFATWLEMKAKEITP